MVSGRVPACRSEEKALAAIENITFELEAAASAIRHNTNTEIKGQVRYMPTLPYARAKGGGDAYLYGSIVAHRKPRGGPKGACPPNSRFKRCGGETRAGVHLVLRGTAVNSSVGELLVRVWCLQRDYCQRDYC